MTGREKRHGNPPRGMKGKIESVKRLGLFRHAKSSWKDTDLRDFDRGLNTRGRKGAVVMGRHIAEHGPVWDILLASPALRVRETLDRSLPALPQPPAIVWEDQLYLANVPTMLDLLRQIDGDPGSVLLAGHNPGLQDLLAALVADAARDDLFDEAMRKFPTAAYAVLELDIAQWADAEESCGRLVHFARPRDLDPALGPKLEMR